MPASPLDRVGLLRRLGAIAYDLLIVAALLWAASLPTGGLDLDQPGVARLAYQLGLGSVILGYFVGFWRYRAATVGMRAWGLRIEAEGGTRPAWRHCLLRAAAALISWAALGLGFWLSLLRADRRCWHDRASRTRLVRR